MSQVVSLGNVASTPAVPTSFTANDSTIAIPILNNLNVFAAESNENNDNGIDTHATAGTMHVLLTNRVTNGISTIDAAPTVGLTFALGASPGVYYINGDIAVFDTTDNAGAAYSFTWGVRTDGSTATTIGTNTGDIFEEVALSAATFALSVSGNDLVVTVTGIAATDINWNIYLNYRFVG